MTDIKSMVSMKVIRESATAIAGYAGEGYETKNAEIMAAINTMIDSIAEDGVSTSSQSEFMMMAIGYIMGRDPDTAKVISDYNVSFDVLALLMKETLIETEDT